MRERKGRDWGREERVSVGGGAHRKKREKQKEKEEAVGEWKGEKVGGSRKKDRAGPVRRRKKWPMGR